jgi:hypothetical protein
MRINHLIEQLFRRIGVNRNNSPLPSIVDKAITPGLFFLINRQARAVSAF